MKTRVSLCIGLLAVAASAPASAQRYGHPGEFAGHAYAESRYGHGSISGPVRYGPRGRLEVRMPRGTWIECGRSCSETLRRETIDFWESRGGRNDGVDGPGYFRWRW
jgi:hypothetical protein